VAFLWRSIKGENMEDDIYEEADGMMTDWDWFVKQPLWRRNEIIKGKKPSKKISKTEYRKRHDSKNKT
tara:strand:- start:4334 stop:4537 length:204 start_codon:yes stop_codon:yes gene_type:complete